MQTDNTTVVGDRVISTTGCLTSATVNLQLQGSVWPLAHRDLRNVNMCVSKVAIALQASASVGLLGAVGLLGSTPSPPDTLLVPLSLIWIYSGSFASSVFSVGIICIFCISTVLYCNCTIVFLLEDPDTQRLIFLHWKNSFMEFLVIHH